MNMQRNCTVEVSYDQVETLSSKIAEVTREHIDIAKVTSAIDDQKQSKAHK